jgi:ketosteroid isomerase-like protein
MRHLFAVFRATVLVWALGAGLLAAPARAEVSAENAQAVQATVQAQLAAFAADDAERAFSFATLTIRTMFQTPANFLAMVRQAYPAVYRPAKVLFLSPRALDAAVVQPVQLKDAADQSWLAMYTLQRQADGRWLINGCVLVPDRSLGA